MKSLYIILCLLLFSFFSIGQITQKGIIVSEKSNNPIVGASIFISQEVFTSTNTAGEFSLNIGDSVFISISHLSYYTKSLWIKKKNSPFYISLKPLVVKLSDVVVSGLKSNSKTKPIETIVLSISDIEAMPAQFGEIDVLKILEHKPGVFRANELNSAIHVRGGSGGHNSFVIDGQNVFNPNHLLGFMSTFNADLIQEVSLQKNGFSTQLGGSLSSYFQIKNRIGNLHHFKGKVGIGLLSSRAMLEGPIKKASSSFIIGIRKSYFDFISKSYNSMYQHKEGFTALPEYNFNDIQLKLHSKLLNNLYGDIAFFNSGDKLKLEKAKGKELYTEWGNKFVNINLKYYPTEKITMAFVSGYSSYKFNFNSRSRLLAHNDVGRFNNNFNIDYSYSHKMLIKLGVFYQLSNYNYNTILCDGSLIYNSFAVSEKSKYYGTYLQTDYAISDNILASAGVRFNVFDTDKIRTSIAPRIVLSYVKELCTITLAYSRTFQYEHLVNSFGMNMPTDLWYPSLNGFPVEKGDQLSLNYSTNITPDLHISLTTYYKEMKDIFNFRDGSNILFKPLNSQIVLGKGKSKGIESSINLRKDNYNIDLNYTYACTEHQFEDINNGLGFSPPFDLRHNINISGSYRFTDNIDFSFTWFYASPQLITFPTSVVAIQGAYTSVSSPTIIPVFENRYNLRMIPTHRLDIAIKYKRKHKKGKSMYIFSIYNLYNKANPYFLYFSENKGNSVDNTTRLELKQKSLIPFLPSINYTYEF